MGYTTDFEGSVSVEPPLSAEEISFLTKFSESRRMKCKQGPYFVKDQGYPSIIDANEPPDGQPGLWCDWVPTEDGTAIEWNQGEKFYDSAEWMKYLIEHFIGSNPIAKSELPFLQSHVLNGEIKAQGEDPSDRWKLVVKDNVVSKKLGKVVYTQTRISDD